VSITEEPLAAGMRPRRGRAGGLLSAVLRKSAGIACVLAGLVVASFLLVRLIPGDPARSVVGTQATAAQVAVVRNQLGLNGSLPQQFGDYVARLSRGDLGSSFESGASVRTIIEDSLPYTLELALLATVVALVAGIALGMTIAVLCRSGRPWLDGAFQALTSIGASFPEYVAGTLLVLVFAIALGIFPPGGADSLDAIVLPVIAVSLAPTCTLARIVRRETATVLELDYMRAARSKRLPPLRLYARHALPNLMTATLSYAGVLLAGLLSGTIIAENVFAWPGLGSRVVHAVAARDYPVIQGAVIVLGLVAVVATVLVDGLLGALDPRRRRSGT
jgi:peptide/nickel transport system permease protein